MSIRAWHQLDESFLKRKSRGNSPQAECSPQGEWIPRMAGLSCWRTCYLFFGMMCSRIFICTHLLVFLYFAAYVVFLHTCRAFRVPLSHLIKDYWLLTWILFATSLTPTSLTMPILTDFDKICIVDWKLVLVCTVEWTYQVYLERKRHLFRCF